MQADGAVSDNPHYHGTVIRALYASRRLRDGKRGAQLTLIGFVPFEVQKLTAGSIDPLVNQTLPG